MTTTKTELYSVLLNLRTTYQEQLEQLENAEALGESGTGYTNHQADDATIVYDQTVNVSTMRSTRDTLRQIEEALAKYAAGTYGICEHCGNEIDIARLEAIPYTFLCLDCAEVRDYQAGV